TGVTWMHETSQQRIYAAYLLLKAAEAAKIYALSLHDALPIWPGHARRVPHGRADLAGGPPRGLRDPRRPGRAAAPRPDGAARPRSEEHTSELQSRENLVCRLLLEKKKRQNVIRAPVRTRHDLL